MFGYERLINQINNINKDDIDQFEIQQKSAYSSGVWYVDDGSDDLNDIKPVR